MTDIHQSYEDFRLDALLQYDLAGEEEDIEDSGSVNSGIVDEATFDELYTSIPDVAYDDDNTSRRRDVFIRPSALTKRLRKMPSQRIIPTRKAADDKQDLSTPENKKQHRNVLKSVSMLLRPNQGKTNRLVSSEGKRRNKRGIERNISTQTELTALSFDDVAFGQNDDELSCSLCYLENEDGDDNNCDGSNDDNNNTLSSSASTISEVFADDLDDTGNDKKTHHDSISNRTEVRTDKLSSDDLHCSFASCGAALVDECYDIILNTSTDTAALSLDIYDEEEDDDEESDSHSEFMTSDPMLNRSLPIIQSRGLQDLFFDDYDENDALGDRFHHSVASGACISSRHRRPYTICDF